MDWAAHLIKKVVDMATGISELCGHSTSGKENCPHNHIYFNFF